LPDLEVVLKDNTNRVSLKCLQCEVSS
jgi:hypothetical protein